MSAIPPVILNVEDNEIARYSKSRVLRFAGFDVIEAASGTEALQMVTEHPVDLVLLDVNLPDISGYEVCLRIKRDPKLCRIPIIMTSAAFTKGPDRARGLEGGADGYLIAPIEPEVMKATITSVLRTREAEDQAVLAVKQWESTFRSITEGIAVLDAQGLILRYNDSFAKLAGKINIVGQSIESFLIQLDVRIPMKLTEAIRESYKDQFELLIGNRWYELMIEPVVQSSVSDGVSRRAEMELSDLDAPGSIAILNDVTERREFEQKIIQARNIAESASAAKDRFLAVLSHELRTPLTPVMMLVDSLLSDSTLDQTMREALEIIYRNIQLEARLIDDLLDLNRISRGKMNFRNEKVDLISIAKHAIEISRQDMKDKDISIHEEFEADKVNVFGDPARLQQVLWNLIKNAVKFTSAGGKIVIHASNPEADIIEVQVQDNGIGIDQPSLARIFEPFEQADLSITKRFGGLGLGLAICKNIVDLHHGTLVASSEGAGQGATFTLRLPLLAAN